MNQIIVITFGLGLYETWQGVAMVLCNLWWWVHSLLRCKNRIHIG